MFERRTHDPLTVLAMCLICALLGYGAFVGVVREIEVKREMEESP